MTTGAKERLQRKLLLVAIGTVLSLLSWLGPPYLFNGSDRADGMLFLPGTATDAFRATIVRLGGLFVTGSILAWLDQKFGSLLGSLLLGSLLSVPMILVSTLDVSLGLHRHNLYGIEIVVYVVYSTPGILGILATRAVRKYLLPSPRQGRAEPR